jgi:N-formylglutamate amidohydrolase
MNDSMPQRIKGESWPGERQKAAFGGIESGGSVPGTSRPAFTMHRGGPSALPVLIAVPHAGRAYAPGVIEAMRHGAPAAHRLEDRFVDLVGRAAASDCGASLLLAHVPRAIIDLNRDIGDIDRGMFTGDPPVPRPETTGMPYQQPRSARGLGLFPRRLPGMGELWRQPMTSEEADRRIAGVHVPYHRALDAELDRLREMHGHAILIDLHSMPSLPKQGRAPAATHVLGDRFGASCASALSAAAMELLARSFGSPAYNRPYAGGYVLDRHGRPRRDIHALQLEIDRARYLDDQGQPMEGGVAGETRLVARLAEVLTAVLRGSSRYSEAAE